MTVKRRKKDPAVKAAKKTEAYARAVLVASAEAGAEIPIHDTDCAAVESGHDECCTCDPMVMTVGEKAQA